MNLANLNERGQVTIPKKIREKANLRPNDAIKIDLNKRGQIIITKRDFFDDIDDLIRQDLVREGCEPYEMEIKVAERKRALASALLEKANEIEKEIAKGEYVKLDKLKEELTNDSHV